jgi:trans-aconitate methyltransferase
VAYEFDGEKYKIAATHQRTIGENVIASLALRGNENILDLGCGDGAVTEQLAKLVPEGRVLGIDASKGMIQTARKSLLRNLEFECMDICDISFEEEFDLIFSNAALHWVKDHERLVLSAKRALKKNGVIRWNFGGRGNCSNLIQVLMNCMSSEKCKAFFDGFEWPWFMPAPDFYSELLTRAGFKGIKAVLQNADCHYPDASAMEKWIDQPCLVPFLEHIKNDDAKILFRNDVVSEMLRKTACNDGTYFESFRRIDIAAVK